MDPWKLLWDQPPPSRQKGWMGGMTSPRIFLLSFATLILLGALGFLVLPGLYTGPGLSPLDALFTSTSAVCVTGLVVVDTATYFTPIGQAWIALLIQIGGLGILTFTSFLALGMGHKAGLHLEEASGVPGHHLGALRRENLVRAIVVLTLTIEAAGALGLWLSWRGEMGNAGAIWPAVFHAISAFCNAGFSTFSDSLVGYREAPATLLLVMALVVLGGLGFLVLEEVRTRLLGKSLRRLSLHSKLVLTVTAVLLVASWAMFCYFEWSRAMGDLSPLHRLTNGAFLAVTPRTAGFNTLDYGSADNPSLFLSILLMLVGGSPGSTAGGMKTVTAGLLVLLLVARLRGRSRVSAFDRSISRDTIQRAMSLVVGGAMILAGAIFVLTITELPVGGPENRVEFLSLIFEAVSAFGTTGLSMGVTATLSGMGRVIIILLMFVGRVGPLALVAAMSLAGRRTPSSFRYGEEQVIIG
jgi:trk system potassium uptake protein TrkH